MTAKHTDHSFEWVVSENGFEVEAEAHAPPAIEAAPQPVSAREPWHLPRRATALYVILPTLTVIALVWGFIQWRDWQTLQTLVAAVNLYAPTPDHLPLNYLRLRDDPPILGAMTTTANGDKRIEVKYAFVAPNGDELRFSVPQVFRQTSDGRWAYLGQAADDSPKSVYNRTTPHLELRYLASDADFMLATLGPYLDEVLNTACEAWGCEGEVRVVLDFTNPAAARRSNYTRYAAGSDDPLLLHVLLNSSQPTAPYEPWALPPPHVAGYPVGAASLQLYRRTVALQALWRLASVVNIRPDQPRPESVLFNALLARQAARWGLEAPDVLTITGDGEPLSLDDLGLPVRGVESGRALRGALALLHELLHDQPLEVEARIFRAAREGRDTFGPILTFIGESGRGGLKPEQVIVRMQSVLDPADREAWRLRPAFQPEAILTCDAGLYAYGAGQSQRLLPGIADGFGAWPIDWSPDGRRLALSTYFFLGFVLDLETGETRWTPDISGDTISIPVGFTASGALAYHRFAWPTGPDFDFSQVEWRLFDPRTTEPARTGARGIWSLGFLPFHIGPNFSPDRQWVIVTDQPDSGDWPLRFSVSPAEGGEPVAPRAGYLPTWSPDNRLAYFRPQAAANAPLHLVVHDDPASPEVRTILTFDWQPGPGRELPQVAWSPTGDRLAFILGADEAERVALGVVSPTGEGLQLTGVEGGEVGRFAISPDGLTLALLTSEQQTHNLVLYDAETLTPIRTLAGQWRDFSWAPDGRLWLFGESGVFALGDAANPRGDQPSRLMDRQCGSVIWRP